METVTIDVVLTENGVAFEWEPAWDESRYADAIDQRLRSIKAYSVMGRTAEIVREPGYMEFVDEESISWVARGLPIQITKEQAREVEEQNKQARKEHRFDEVVDVVEEDGCLWVLSPYAGHRRIAVNVRARLAVARKLGCEYVVEDGNASWVGRFSIHVEER